MSKWRYKSISKFSSILYFFVFIACNLLILESFIEINNCNDNWVPAKKVNKIFNSNIIKYYINKETEAYLSREEEHMSIKLNLLEVLMSFELLHSSKVPEDIDSLMITTQLQINHTNKINNNIDIINKLIYEEKRVFTYIVKLLRIPIKTFIKSMNKNIKQTNDQRN